MYFGSTLDLQAVMGASPWARQRTPNPPFQFFMGSVGSVCPNRVLLEIINLVARRTFSFGTMFNALLRRGSQASPAFYGDCLNPYYLSPSFCFESNLSGSLP